MNEYLEIYKIHARAADMVSQRRDAMHRLFVSVFVVLAASIGALARLSDEPLSPLVMGLMSGMGVILSVAWLALLKSYRQLNTGKFKAMDELESHLAFPFYRREWQILKKGESWRVYWKMTVVEQILPFAFLLMSLSLLVFSFF